MYSTTGPDKFMQLFFLYLLNFSFKFCFPNINCYNICKIYLFQILHGPGPDIPIFFSGELVNPVTHTEIFKAISRFKMQWLWFYDADICFDDI